MPGSSVSACHLCHLHSHNHDNLVRTSPLRHSRGRSKVTKYSSGSHRHHHGHSNSGYSLRDEGVERSGRFNSSSALARLTDHSHSLPGSRSNSLSRFHREVSTLPDGGDTYTGHEMRHSNSTRSLNLNPPLTTLLDNRTTSLPRVSTTLHSHPEIHAQPDILVNALPRSRANSRSGSLPRNPVTMSQDNSHDYYLDMHRQRFKEDKQKHRFNLQTVMLIGCYTLLVMIAIVVGVVLCYQNGWFGLGPPQEKISGNRLPSDRSNIVGLEPSDKNRPTFHDANGNLAYGDGRNRPRNSGDTNAGFTNSPSIHNNKYLHSAGLSPTIFHRQSTKENGPMENQSKINPSPVDSQSPNSSKAQGSNSERAPDARHRDNHSHPSRTNSNPEEPWLNNRPPKNQLPGGWLEHGQSPPQAGHHPNNNNNAQSSNKHLGHTFILTNQNPSFDPMSNNPNSGHVTRPSTQHQDLNSQILTNVLPPSNPQPSQVHHHNSHSNISNHHPIGQASTQGNGPNISPVTQHLLNKNPLGISNPQLNPHVREFPSTVKPDLFSEHGFSSIQNENKQATLTPVKPDEKTPPLRQGNLDTNTIAKTLLQGNALGTQEQRLTSLSSNSNRNQHIFPDSNPKGDLKFHSAQDDSPNSSFADKILRGDTNTFSTQELLDLIAIRRMRDLLNSKGNTKTILDLLRNVEPSFNTRLESIEEEKLTPSEFQSKQETLRGSGRNIKDAIKVEPNNFQIRELIEALRGHSGVSSRETSIPQGTQGHEALQNSEATHQTSLNNLINKTINGAIIRLINSRVDELKKGNINPNLNFNVSGISVLPVNSKDLKILLETTPTNAQEDLGNLSKERLRGLQILQKLIELKDHKVERHVDSSLPVLQDTGVKPIGVDNSKESQSGSLVPSARISDSLNPEKINSPLKSSTTFSLQNNPVVSIRNITSTFSRGHTAVRNIGSTAHSTTSSSSRGRTQTVKPDPSFALMVRTDGLGGAADENKPVFPPRFISSRRRSSRARTRSVTATAPIREQVAVRPGRSRSRSPSPSPAVVRAWTHMDSKGTLSKGKVHSDGSFTFTNCRPRDVCDQDSPHTRVVKKRKISR